MSKVDRIMNIGGNWCESPYWPLMYYGDFDKGCRNFELMAEDWTFQEFGQLGLRLKK